MSSAEYDLNFLEAGLESLESYLLSKDIYRPLGVQAGSGQTPYPQFTLGWLLLFQQRALATSQSADEVGRLQRINRRIEAILIKWRSALNQKARAEFRARLNLWRDFLVEYGQNPSQHYDRYPYEVNRRVMLHLLGENADQLPAADQQALNGLDLILQASFNPGDFVWDRDLISSFPATVYWYLYGEIKQKGANE